MKKKVPTYVIIIIFLAGLSLMLYPSFSNWYNQQHQTRAIAGYVEKTDDMSAANRKKMWDEAVAYNKALAKKPMNFILSDEEYAEYEKTLDVTGTGIMAYISIPSIGIYLPIYHGTDDAVLQIAVGHIAGSSLPVGGKSTHCVISGHTGLPSAKLFTDLRKMKKGDHFMLETLDETLTYEVDQIKTVKPDDVSDLKIQKGKDLCTLVSCTPYGINTDRLLVRGHRVENEKKEVKVASESAVSTSKAPLIYIIIAILLAIGFIIIIVPRKKKSRKQ